VLGKSLWFLVVTVCHMWFKLARKKLNEIKIKGFISLKFLPVSVTE